MAIDGPEDLTERSFRFACDVYDFCEELIRVGELPRRVAHQLFDAAASIGANRSEATSSYGDREFAAKNAIALKEAREARFWLRLADAKSLASHARRRRLLVESNELISIYVHVVRTLRAKLKESRSRRS